MRKDSFDKQTILKLKNFIRQRVDDPADVEEILQETLISANDCLALYSRRSSFFTWLCGIAKHEITDFYRKKKIKTFLFSRLPWLENLASEALGPEQMLLREETIKKVQKSLKSLSEGYQQVLRLKYYQGLSVKEIARQLNETVKTIESRLFRARQAFAKAFGADDFERRLSSFS
ncbi:MAG: RNA polymerase sigma factor [Microgenomates group bacterium]